MYDASLSIFLVQGAMLHFLQTFLNFTNSLRGEYVNQFWLPHTRRLLIGVFNFRLSALLSFVYKILVQSIKCRKVDAMPSILRKNLKFYKIRTFPPISAKFLKENFTYFIYNYKELFSSELEISGTWSDNAPFPKNSKFREI